MRHIIRSGLLGRERMTYLRQCGRASRTASLHACTTNSGLDDKLVFELPDLDLATELTKRLEEHWPCSDPRGPRGGGRDRLPAHDGDGELAQLLRRVEAWVAARSLGAIRYWLDHRAYILEAGYTSDVPVFTQVR